jgi:hypothetical protein
MEVEGVPAEERVRNWRVRLQVQLGLHEKLAGEEGKRVLLPNRQHPERHGQFIGQETRIRFEIIAVHILEDLAHRRLREIPARTDGDHLFVISQRRIRDRRAFDSLQGRDHRLGGLLAGRQHRLDAALVERRLVEVGVDVPCTALEE